MSISRVDLLNTPTRTYRPQLEAESDFRALLECAQGTASAKSKAIPPGPAQTVGGEGPGPRPVPRISPEFGGTPALTQGTANGKHKAIPPGPAQLLGGEAPRPRPEPRFAPESDGTPVNAQGTSGEKCKAIPPGPPQSLGGQIQPFRLMFRDLLAALEGGDHNRAQRAFDHIHDEALRRLAESARNLDPKGGPLLSFFEELSVLGQKLQAGDGAGAKKALTALLEKYPRVSPQFPASDSLSFG